MINTMRHAEIFDSNKYKDKRIVVVGLGAIGSRVAENLISTGLTNLCFIDYDTVESHNLANQLFNRDDIGEFKVEALHLWARHKAGADAVKQMTFINGKAESTCAGWFNEADIVISCVDTFTARSVVCALATAEGTELFIDTRMASGHAMQFMINPANPADVRKWAATLGDDDDPQYETSVCGTSLSVGVISQTIGAVTSASVMNYLKTEFKEYVLRIDTAPWLVSRTDQG